MVNRNRHIYEEFAHQHNSPINDMLSEQGIDDIKCAEGILIEAFRREYGHFPPWNKIGGSQIGQTRVMKNNINIVKSFCRTKNFKINPLVSRSTIRELSLNPQWERYENFLHAARMFVLLIGIEFDDAIKFLNEHDPLGTYEEMKKYKYLEKQLTI